MSIMALDGVLPRSRSSDPMTSVDAGRKADLSGSGMQVLEFLNMFPGREWIDKHFVPAIRRWAELNDRRVYTEQRYRSARSELGDRIEYLDKRAEGSRMWRLS